MHLGLPAEAGLDMLNPPQGLSDPSLWPPQDPSSQSPPSYSSSSSFCDSIQILIKPTEKHVEFPLADSIPSLSYQRSYF